MAKSSGLTIKGGKLVGQGAAKVAVKTLWDMANRQSDDYRYLPIDDIDAETSLLASFVAIRKGGHKFTKAGGNISHGEGLNQAINVHFDIVGGDVILKGSYCTSKPEAGDYKLRGTTKAAVDKIVADEAKRKADKAAGKTSSQSSASLVRG